MIFFLQLFYALKLNEFEYQIIYVLTLKLLDMIKGEICVTEVSNVRACYDCDFPGCLSGTHCVTVLWLCCKCLRR